MARYRVAVDTGGTFSDFVYLNEDTGAVTIAKVPSTPDDPSRAILQGVEALIGARRGRAADVGYFCHGTTVGTNALLEGKGVKTGLLVTEGFRGIYEVAEQARPYGTAIFDVMYDKPALLVPQSLTGEVQGARRFPRQCAACRSTRRRCARLCASSKRKTSKRSPCACCSRFCIPSTKRACARSRARKCRAAISRCPAKSCRRSASITG